MLIGCYNGDECHGKCCAHKDGYEAEHVNTILATPYYYQDMVQERVKENEMPVNGYHSVRYVNPNGSISTKIQRDLPLLTGEPIDGLTYSITIDDSKPISGTIAQDSISIDNNRNESARRIAKTRTGDTPTIWIPLKEPIEVHNNTFTVNFTTDTMDAHESINIQVPDMEPQEFKNRNLHGFIQRQIKLKGYNPNTHSTLVAQNMRFIVQNEPLLLKDVEVLLEEPVPLDVEIRQFTCDPSNIDHVTGLVMALEDHIPDAVDKENATSLFNIINEHRIQLEKNIDNYTSGPRINAAIHEATELLWTNIGLKALVRYYQSKMEKESKGDRKGFGIKYAENMSEKFITSYNNLLTKEEAATNFASRSVAKVRRTAKKRQLLDLKKAVQMRLDTGLNDDLKKKYTVVFDSLKNALEGKLTDEDQYYH